MLLTLALGVALQVQPVVVPPSSSRVGDSVSRVINRRIANRAEREERNRATNERAVTAEDLATAFKNEMAKTLLERARVARMSQDSALLSYDVTAYQRISAGIGFARLGRDRLIFRNEQSGRIRWHRDAGIWVDVTGARTVIPGTPDIGEREARKGLAEASGEMLPVPYFPGYEPLWAGPEAAHESIDEVGPVHPIALGSEAYYTYRAGDSLTISLPDKRSYRLRALEIRPRESKWNLVVGTLWFDEATGQLVRAAYRFAVPMQIDKFVLEQEPDAFDEVPKWVKPLIFPMTGEVSVIAIEYGLYGGRFWLPRSRAAEGNGSASFMRVPFKIEQSFKYHSVNGLDSLPRIPIAQPIRPPDSLSAEGRQAWRDSVNAARSRAARARRDSVRAGLLRPSRPIAQCDTNAYEVSAGRRYGRARIPVATRTPCSAEALENSPDMPASIYDPGDELFDLKAREALIGEALSMGAQPPFTLNPRKLPRPDVSPYLRLVRYNRIEGLSPGAEIDQQLGGGYTLHAGGRIGFADRIPNVDLTLTRSNLSSAVYLSGYKRLVAAGDWGKPLSFGSSLSSFLWGRDEGFYYRSAGVEFGGRTERGTPIEWRFFSEEQQTASRKTAYSVGGNNRTENILARRDVYSGIGARVKHTYGADPNGFRIFSDLRLESAMSDSIYGRGALDVAFTHGVGPYSGALTLSTGSSIGALPTQRQWYLGGTHTVRGQSPDPAQTGNAFWLTRLEVGRMIQGARPVLFTDIGWIGDRGRMRDVGRPLSGVGAGASLLDGLIRFDMARGLYPRRQWRVDLYVDAVF